jgi:hypothetical protein
MAMTGKSCMAIENFMRFYAELFGATERRRGSGIGERGGYSV